MTIRQLEKNFIDDLSLLYGFDEARNLAWLCISFVCVFDRMQYLAAKERDLLPKEESTLADMLAELKTGKPLQYVLGETEFYGLPFKVDSSVLIPRPETEELVDWILKDIRNADGLITSHPFNILDIGTGSGCIPITLKKNIPDARVFAIDISEEAIKTAKANSVLNQTKVTFLKDDILNPVKREIFDTSFSLIVSNPPYVTDSEKGLMHQNVLAFEPHTALFVRDDDPLMFYKAIADFAKNRLQENGKLYLEINETLGEQTKNLLRETGFVNIILRTDLPGRDRMIRAELPEDKQIN